MRVDILIHMPRVKGAKRLSSLLRIARIELRVPEDLKEWLTQKAEKEGKSLSLLITEILETARQKDEEGKQ